MSSPSDSPRRRKAAPPGRPAEPDGLRIDYLNLAVLVSAPRNPKRHDLGALSTSFARFGYVSPILLDERTGRIAAGHGRLDALQQAQIAGQTPPARVTVGPKGEWLVPVIRGVTAWMGP